MTLTLTLTQDVINRVQWTHASLTSGSEHVIASSASQTEQQLYVWDLHGHLTKTLEGPKDGATSFVCHPSRPILACCSRSGALYLWSKLYSENWSAFAPDPNSNPDPDPNPNPDPNPDPNQVGFRARLQGARRERRVRGAHI